MATPIGFEPTISTVTGWHVRPLHHGAVSQLFDSKGVSGVGQTWPWPTSGAWSARQETGRVASTLPGSPAHRSRAAPEDERESRKKSLCEGTPLALPAHGLRPRYPCPYPHGLRPRYSCSILLSLDVRNDFGLTVTRLALGGGLCLLRRRLWRIRLRWRLRRG